MVKIYEITTLEGALEYVQAVKVCTLLSNKVAGLPALWDSVDLPENGGGRTKWGARVEADLGMEKRITRDVSGRGFLRKNLRRVGGAHDHGSSP